MTFRQKLPRSGRLQADDLFTLGNASAKRGRGAVSNAEGRFEKHRTVRFDDGWENDFDPISEASDIQWHREVARSIITRNQSPDISFDTSINPYRGASMDAFIALPAPLTPISATRPALTLNVSFISRRTARFC